MKGFIGFDRGGRVNPGPLLLRIGSLPKRTLSAIIQASEWHFWSVRLLWCQRGYKDVMFRVCLETSQLRVWRVKGFNFQAFAA